MVSAKASADMWWIIIGAVLALVVLIVLMVIFTGKVPVDAFSDCESKSGLCTEMACPQGTVKSSAFVCVQEGQNCCLGLPKKCTNYNDPVCKGGECADYEDGKTYCR